MTKEMTKDEEHKLREDLVDLASRLGYSWRRNLADFPVFEIRIADTIYYNEIINKEKIFVKNLDNTMKR